MMASWSNSLMYGNVGATAVVAFVLTVVGRRVVEIRPRWKPIGSLVGLAAFLALFAFLAIDNSSDGIGCAAAAMRGALGGVVSTGAVWIVGPALSVLHHFLIAESHRRGRLRWQNLLYERQREEAEESRCRNQQEMAEEERRKQEVSEREAPERSRLTQALNEEQRRRDCARAQCEIVYRLLGPEIDRRFTKNMLDEYMSKYMTERSTVEDVEERGGQLRTLMQQHKDKVEPAELFRTLEDVIRWYVGQKHQIESSVGDEELCQTLLGELHMRYADLSMATLEQKP